jgi:hypothetical protein
LEESSGGVADNDPEDLMILELWDHWVSLH